MPRKGRSNKAGSASVNRNTLNRRFYDTEVATGRALFNTSPANANSVTVDNLNPARFGGRIADLSALFTEWRFTRLVFHGLQLRAGVTTILAYTPAASPTNAEPVSRADCSEIECSAPFWWASTRPDRLVVTRAYLLGTRENNWFKTEPNAAVDDQLEYQGTLFAAGIAQGASAELWVDYTVEFQGRVPSSTSSVTRQEVVQPRGILVQEELPPLTTWAELDAEETKSQAPSHDATTRRPSPAVQKSRGDLNPSKRKG